MWKLYVLAGAVAASFYFGWQWGADRVEARYAADQAKLQRELNLQKSTIEDQGKALAASRDRQAALVRELEDAARKAPGADRPGLTPDGVQRLRNRWGR